MIKRNLKNNKGITLMETVFYVSIFALMSIVIINCLIVMMKSYKETIITRNLVQGGIMIEKISREIRQAYDIDPASTGTDLKLLTTDNSGNPRTVEFEYDQTGLMAIVENGVSFGDLTISNVKVANNFAFTPITTAKGKAVKIHLNIRSTNDTTGLYVQDFDDTIVLRGSYQ